MLDVPDSRKKWFFSHTKKKNHQNRSTIIVDGINRWTRVKRTEKKKYPQSNVINCRRLKIGRRVFLEFCKKDSNISCSVAYCCCYLSTNLYSLYKIILCFDKKVTEIRFCQMIILYRWPVNRQSLLDSEMWNFLFNAIIYTFTGRLRLVLW